MKKKPLPSMHKIASWWASELTYISIAEKLTSANFTSRTGSAKFSEGMAKRIDDA